MRIDIEVECGECGVALQVEADRSRPAANEVLRLIARPCERCLSDAAQKGHDKGYDAGREAGRGEG